MLCFAIMAWSPNMRIQLAGLIVSLILVNSAMVNRTLEVVRRVRLRSFLGCRPHRELVPARVNEMEPATAWK